jgi:hypothetical protein
MWTTNESKRDSYELARASKSLPWKHHPAYVDHQVDVSLSDRLSAQQRSLNLWCVHNHESQILIYRFITRTVKGAGLLYVSKNLIKRRQIPPVFPYCIFKWLRCWQLSCPRLPLAASLWQDHAYQCLFIIHRFLLCAFSCLLYAFLVHTARVSSSISTCFPVSICLPVCLSDDGIQNRLVGSSASKIASFERSTYMTCS